MRDICVDSVVLPDPPKIIHILLGSFIGVDVDSFLEVYWGLRKGGDVSDGGGGGRGC